MIQAAIVNKVRHLDSIVDREQLLWPFYPVKGCFVKRRKESEKRR